MTNIIGASVWEQELYDHIVHHVEAEQSIIHEYIALAESSPSESLRFVARMIAEDEKRHHGLMRDLAESVRSGAELRPEQTPVPALDVWKNRDEIVAATERFLAVENEDARELKKLSKSLKSVKDTTLWDLLVELMRKDTEKHILMLEFIRDHASRRMI